MDPKKTNPWWELAALGAMLAVAVGLEIYHHIAVRKNIRLLLDGDKASPKKKASRTRKPARASA